jgi:hypothetical protein
VRIEFTKDGGKTWDVWVYLRPEQDRYCREIYGRLVRGYPAWAFRIVKDGVAVVFV